MTVAELRELIKDAEDCAVVRVAYNSGCSYDDANSVEFDTEGGFPVVYISTEEEQKQS